MSTLKPVGKNFLVTPFTQSKKKKGGILLPDSAVTPTHIWLVEEVGGKCELVKKGNLVILHSLSGVEPLEHGGKKFGLANEIQVEAIVEEK